MIPLAAIAVAGCLAVNADSDRITAADLAAAIPGLSIPPSTEAVSLAPSPGVQRIFHVPELRRLALRLHWDVEPSADICVERPVAPPDPEQLLAAMRKTLPQADITILDFGRQQLPAGDLEFPASGLRPATGGALWTGYVRYAGSRRFTLWARVKALASVTRVIAAADLRPGGSITAAQLHLETREELPARGSFLKSADEAVGKWPRTALRAGTEIRPEMLENPKQIARGDTVTVEVRNGAAHLEMEMRAEAAGSAGDTIPVLNPSSHKRFMALVEGKGRVSVTVPRIDPANTKVNQ